jgi:hypothetical protein
VTPDVVELLDAGEVLEAVAVTVLEPWIEKP